MKNSVDEVTAGWHGIRKDLWTQRQIHWTYSKQIKSEKAEQSVRDLWGNSVTHVIGVPEKVRKRHRINIFQIFFKIHDPRLANLKQNLNKRRRKQKAHRHFIIKLLKLREKQYIRQWNDIFNILKENIVNVQLHIQWKCPSISMWKTQPTPFKFPKSLSATSSYAHTLISVSHNWIISKILNSNKSLSTHSSLFL